MLSSVRNIYGTFSPRLEIFNLEISRLKRAVPRTLYGCNETLYAEPRMILVTVPAHTIVFMVSYTRKAR